MLRSALILSLALAACSAPHADNSAAPANTAEAAPPSAEALAARAVAQRYFDLLRAKDFRAAYGLWSPDAASTIGDLDAFIKGNREFADYDGTAGAPSAVRASGGQEYVLVEASAQATLAKGGRLERHGVVMLKRPAAKQAPWRIWGVDVRERRCRAGETPRGLGCVKRNGSATKA